MGLYGFISYILLFKKVLPNLPIFFLVSPMFSLIYRENIGFYQGIIIKGDYNADNEFVLFRGNDFFNSWEQHPNRKGCPKECLKLDSVGNLYRNSDMVFHYAGQYRFDISIFLFYDTCFYSVYGNRSIRDSKKRTTSSIGYISSDTEFLTSYIFHWNFNWNVLIISTIGRTHRGKKHILFLQYFDLSSLCYLFY